MFVGFLFFGIILHTCEKTITMNAQYNIIILEDDIFFGNLIKNFLMNQGYNNVKLFHNDEDCINSITSEPTLIILDHHLINSTGLETMQRINKLFTSVTFIYLSGQEYVHVALKSLQFGAVDYIEKNKNCFYNLKSVTDQIVAGSSSNNLLTA